MALTSLTLKRQDAESITALLNNVHNLTSLRIEHPDSLNQPITLCSKLVTLALVGIITDAMPSHIFGAAALQLTELVLDQSYTTPWLRKIQLSSLRTLSLRGTHGMYSDMWQTLADRAPRLATLRLNDVTFIQRGELSVLTSLTFLDMHKTRMSTNMRDALAIPWCRVLARPERGRRFDA